jgi:hypothetical protein
VVLLAAFFPLLSYLVSPPYVTHINKIIINIPEQFVLNNNPLICIALSCINITVASMESVNKSIPKPMQGLE